MVVEVGSERRILRGREEEDWAFDRGVSRGQAASGEDREDEVDATGCKEGRAAE